MLNKILVLVLCTLFVPTATAITGTPSTSGTVPAASGPACDPHDTVCATSTANATVTCVDVDLLTVECSGTATIGGTGWSPVGLPGYVTWSGNASCGGVCNDNTTLGADTESWGVLGGAAGSDITFTFSNVTVVRPLIGCIEYTVTASVDATASTILQLSSATAPTSQAEASGTVCAIV